MTINRLKMELQSKREKARRLEKNRKRLRQNGLFQRDARRFYRELGKQTIRITSPPSESEIEQYWGDILETEVCLLNMFLSFDSAGLQITGQNIHL